MQIRQIDLDGEELPASVTVRLSASEALYLAELTGGQNGTTANAVMQGGALLNSEIYSGLSGGVFNRFYDDGVRDALRRRTITNSNSQVQE